jgi:hypothetical protein
MFNRKFLFIIILAVGSSIIWAQISIEDGYYLNDRDTVIINKSLGSFIFSLSYDTLSVDQIVRKIEVLIPDSNKHVQTIIDSMDERGGISVVDINLDGYLDLRENYGFYQISPAYCFRLFDPRKNIFELLNELCFSDYYIDTVSKVIEEHNQSTGGRGGESNKYKIINGRFQLIESIYSNKDEYEKKQLVNNSMRIVELAETEEADSFIIVLSYSLIYDSLRIVEKLWKIFTENPDEAEMKNKLICCEPYGCFLCFKKILYSYERKNGKIYRNEKHFEVIDNKWEKVVRE